MNRFGLFLTFALIAAACVPSVEAARTFDSPLLNKVYIPFASADILPEHGAGSTYDIPFPGATWCYDWGTEPDCGRNSVPMIWDERSVGTGVSDSEWVLGFNEPELETQANITPTYAAELWREIETLYPDRKLVSPAASTYWLNQWWAAYQTAYGQSPRVDAVASHCYGVWNPEAAISRCKAVADWAVDWAQAHDIPEVWVTEFAHLPCWDGGEAGSIEFMQAMVAYYRETPEITRWAWFQTAYHGTEPWAFGEYCNTSLIDIDTAELTAMGEAYRTLNAWPY